MGWMQAFALVCLLAAVRAQSGYPRDRPALARPLLNPLGRPIIGDDVYGDEIPGEAGIDYPVLAAVPLTNFRCDALPYPGYYADQQAFCQVFYICEKGGRGTGFLCPNGTLFNQEFLVCDWWNHVDCALAVDFYSVNEAVVRAMEEVDAATLARRATQNGVFFNARGEPLSAARIPGGRSSNYSPLGLDRAFVSPAIRSRLRNRYPTGGRLPAQNILARVPLLNVTPRPVLGFPKAFNTYRPQTALRPLNNKYPYRPQGTVGALNNKYQYRPQGTVGVLNNKYPYRLQGTFGALNNNYPYRPQGTTGALNNKYPNRPQGTVGTLNNGYANGPTGSARTFNDGFNSLATKTNNIIAANNANTDNQRYGNDSGEYRENNRANENGSGGNEGPDDGNYSNKNSKGVTNDGRDISNKPTTRGNNGEANRDDNGSPREYSRREGNAADRGNEMYRDDGGNGGGSEDGYFYDRPRNELKDDSQVFGAVDPSKSYLPPLK